MKEGTNECEREPDEFWRQVAMSAIIDYEIKCKLHLFDKRETRVMANKRKTIKKKCDALCAKRLLCESHLKVHFKEDIPRSIAELNYAIDQLG